MIDLTNQIWNTNNFVIIYLRGVKIWYDILTPGQIRIVFVSVKITSIMTTKEIINMILI